MELIISYFGSGQKGLKGEFLVVSFPTFGVLAHIIIL